MPTNTAAAPPANKPAIAPASRTCDSAAPAFTACFTTPSAVAKPTPTNTATTTNARQTIRIHPHYGKPLPTSYFLVTVAVGETVMPSPSAAVTFTLSNTVFA